MNANKTHLTRLIALLLLVVMSISMVGCDKLPFDLDSIFGEQQKDNNPPTCQHEIIVEGKCDSCGEIFPITIAEAIQICIKNPAGTTERYYIRATVKTISDPMYGEMIIEDETGELYVYGTYSSDGALKFSEMEKTPVKGDEVLIHCILSQHNGNNQVKNARLIEFKHEDVDADDIASYKEMTIAEARTAEKSSLVRVKGVVARITYATGLVPSGVILVDSTSSIYVYDRDLAGQVEIGNTVEIAASKAYWILDDEQTSAQKFGYKGSNQLENVILISNDKGNTDFNKTWITETTVKEIMNTPVTEDITSKIFKVNALVKKVPGQGFINYYIDDIDGVTGSYVYTQCNGNDLAWLEEFDGKICTVYLAALNAKSNAAGCVWRFLPVAVSDDGYVFDTGKTAEFVVKYHGVDQFVTKYTGNPQLELITSVSSELLGFENATLSYSSSNENVVYFSTADGKTVMQTGENGTATVTVKGSYNGVDYSEDIEITVLDLAKIESIGVGEAIAAAVDTEVTVRAIVGPSLVNQIGFYLIDSTGVIPVRVARTAFAGLEIGHEVIITGTRSVTEGGKGQICIDNAEIVANIYGKNDYSTSTFITNKTIEEIAATADSAEATAQIYVATATVAKVSKQYGSYTNVTFYVGNLLLYSGSPAQYAWLEGFFAEGETSATLTVELALCDWNAKGLKGCVLAVVNNDGSKVYNIFNFDNN